VQTSPDPGLIDACGVDPSWICEAGWDLTHNELVAGVLDWVVSKPLTALVIVVVAWVVSRLLRRAVGRTTVRILGGENLAATTFERLGVRPPTVIAPHFDDPRSDARATTIAAVLRSTVSVLVWSIAVLMVLGVFEIDLRPLLAGAGIAGIALGFGAQSLVRDCLNGLFILIEDQYGVGDAVDLGPASGTVEALTLRATVVRGVDGTQWHVPNGQILRVGNSSRQFANAIVDVTVGYGTDLERAQEALRQAAVAVCADPDVSEQVLADPVVLGVDRLGAEGAVLRVSVRVSAGAHVEVARRIRRAAKEALDAAGVVWPGLPD
jgi:small conductance mechanosensitive channel